MKTVKCPVKKTVIQRRKRKKKRKTLNPRHVSEPSNLFESKLTPQQLPRRRLELQHLLLNLLPPPTMRATKKSKSKPTKKRKRFIVRMAMAMKTTKSRQQLKLLLPKPRMPLLRPLRRSKRL
jgi:hypothetical protein